MAVSTFRKRWLRRLAWAALTFIFLILATGIFMQTPPGKRMIASLVCRIVSAYTDYELTVDGVTGIVPHRLYIARIEVANPRGDFVAIHDLELRLSLSELLRGRLHVSMLYIHHVTVWQRPIPKERWRLPRLPSLPAWPTVDRLRIERLTLAEAVVGVPVALTVSGRIQPAEGWIWPETSLDIEGLDVDGVHASLFYSYAESAPRLSLTVEDAVLLPELLDMPPPFVLQAKGRGPRADWRATLKMTSGDDILAEGALHFVEAADSALDGELRLHADRMPMMRDYAGLLGDTLEARLAGTIDREGQLHIATATVRSALMDATLAGDVQFERDQADIRLNAHHADLRRIPGMLVAETPLPLGLHVAVQGPFAALAITIAAELEGAPLLEGAADLAVAEPVSLTGRLRALPPPALREAAPTLPEQGLGMVFDISYSETTGELNLAQLDIDGAGLLLQGQGRLTPEAPTLILEASLGADDLNVLGRILALPLSGAARLSLEATGDADGLVLSMTGDAHQIETQAFRLKTGRIDIQGGCADWFSDTPSAIKTTITAHTDALLMEGLKPLDLTLEATVEAPDLDEARMTRFLLSDGNLRLSGSGHFAPTELRGEIVLDADIAAIDGLPVDVDALPGGKGHVSLRAEGGLRPRILTASIEGALEHLEPLPDIARALTGKCLAFNAKATMDNDVVTCTELYVSGASFQVSGHGTYGLDASQLDASAQATLPDLKGPGRAFDQTLEGAITATMEISGMLSELALQADVACAGLRYNDWSTAHARFAIEGQQLATAPDITVSGYLEGAGRRINLNSRAHKVENRILIAPATLAMGDNTITGEAAYDLDTAVPTAAFNAKLPELSAFAALVNLDLDGAVQANLRLDGETLTADARIDSLRFEDITLDRFEAAATLENLYDNARGNAWADALLLNAGPAHVEQLRVEAQGDITQIQATATLDASVDAGLPERHPIVCRLESRITPKEKQLLLERFEGHIGEFPYALENPASATYADGATMVLAPELRIADGRVSLEARHNDDFVSAALRLDAIPLALTRLASEPSVVGRLDGAVTLSGTPQTPEMRIQLAIADAQLDLETAEGFAPLDARVDVLLAQDMLDLSARADMEDTLAFTTTARVPLEWRLQPWHMALPDDGPLAGEAALEVAFTPIIQALGMIEHHLDARLTGAFNLLGTVQAPEASGEAHIRDGRYENAQTGTVLREITLHARAVGPEIELIACHAATGERGAVSIAGALRLLPAEQFPFTAKIAFDDAQLAQLDYLTGRINGNLQAEGALNGAAVRGELTIGPVYVSMPDQLPVSNPPVIEVIEIEDNQVTVQPQMTSGGLASAVGLDITCVIPGRVYVRAPILDSEWGGQLHVGGTLAKPNVEGRIAVARGHLDFLGRRFMLRDSAIAFLGGPPTAPWLDMRATADTPALSAHLNLVGHLEDVKLNLNSEPPLPKDEILAQILFGRDLSRISPLQAIQLARIAAMFNRGLAGLHLFSGNIGLPGIDRLDIRTGERADDTVVGMGKYFTDSVYVEVEQGTTSDSGKISVEVEITPQISVKGDVDARERSGVGLFWRRDY